MWTNGLVGSPLVTLQGPVLLDGACLALARGWAGVWYSHMPRQTASHVGGMSQKFLVASLTVRDAVSPGRSCTRTSPATSRKCPAPLPGLEAGVSQHGNKIYCLSFLNNALAHFKHLLKMDLGQEVLGMRYAECCMSCRVFAAWLGIIEAVCNNSQRLLGFLYVWKPFFLLQEYSKSFLFSWWREAGRLRRRRAVCHRGCGG